MQSAVGGINDTKGEGKWIHTFCTFNIPPTPPLPQNREERFISLKCWQIYKDFVEKALGFPEALKNIFMAELPQNPFVLHLVLKKLSTTSILELRSDL